MSLRPAAPKTFSPAARSTEGTAVSALPIARGVTRQTGFTLLEVLVAFAIMAMALALLYRSMGSSADAIRRADLRQQAIQLAQSLLQSRDHVPPEGWQETGQTDTLGWRVRSRPLNTQNTSPAAITLHEITIVVAPLDTPDSGLTVETLRPQRKALGGEKRP
jgi:general secretion pathway protein I